MYAYIKGKIVGTFPSHIELECRDIAYEIKTPNPYGYAKGEEVKIFIYQHVREDLLQLYGFKSRENKNLFLKLISVKGLGPKGALAILATGNVHNIINAIENADADYLRKFPGVGPKASQQIILDLKGKFKDYDVVVVSDDLSDVKAALRSLGYSLKEINRVVPKIPSDVVSLDKMIKTALQLMLK